MGHIVVCHWQACPPKPRSWRFWGTTISAAGLRGAGLVVKPGPQCLDINVLTLITTQEHRLNWSTSVCKAGS